MPRNAVNVPPHWSDVDDDNVVTAAAAESVRNINADDEDDDNIFSARPAATRANT